jgi:hypothetical protein
MKDVH